MTDTIKPPHAISLWANKDILYVELPHANGEDGTSHLLKLPLNVWGITQALNVVKARSQTSKIGENGDPTQYQSEAAIKEMSRKAAGYTGKITKPKPKITLTDALRVNVRDAMRKAGII